MSGNFTPAAVPKGATPPPKHDMSPGAGPASIPDSQPPQNEVKATSCSKAPSPDTNNAKATEYYDAEGKSLATVLAKLSEVQQINAEKDARILVLEGEEGALQSRLLKQAEEILRLRAASEQTQEEVMSPGP